MTYSSLWINTPRDTASAEPDARGAGDVAPRATSLGNRYDHLIRGDTFGSDIIRTGHVVGVAGAAGDQGIDITDSA